MFQNTAVLPTFMPAEAAVHEALTDCLLTEEELESSIAQYTRVLHQRRLKRKNDEREDELYKLSLLA
jgi:hypothetical protein